MGIDVGGLLRKAAEKTGFVRERYEERMIPTDPSNITVMPFFGDIRSLFVLSSLLLKRYREEERGSKYFIMASWPGYAGLFPYVNEYWGIADESNYRRFYADATRFRNRNELAWAYTRSLNQYFFEDVVLPFDTLSRYYDEGLTDAFWVKYREVVRTLPGVPSTAALGKDFNRELANRGGFKIFVYPAYHVQQWKLNDIYSLVTPREFWVALLKRLLAERFVPVVYRSPLTHDVSPELTDRCIYVREPDMSKVMAVMRATGCVLDIFSGISRLAIAARCPFLMADERARFATLREFEIDDLCSPRLPKQYIFSFPTILEGGPEHLDFNILNGVVARLHAFLPGLDRDEWPPTAECSEPVPYDAVRKRKAMRIGTKLLKIPRD